MKTLIALVAVVIMLIHSGRATAQIVNFESGFADLDPVGVATVMGNSVTFSVGPSSGPTGTAFIAEVGNPETAFAPEDTPAVAVAGGFSLTDEAAGQPLALGLDYFIDFANPVLDLGLDLFDYREDGGPSIGDTATLNAYSDASRTILVGSDSFTIPTPNPIDGNVVTLSIAAPSAPILAAHLTFSGADIGTAIDNVTFTSVPEPTFGVWSLGLMLAGVRWLRRRPTV